MAILKTNKNNQNVFVRKFCFVEDSLVIYGRTTLWNTPKDSPTQSRFDVHNCWCIPSNFELFFRGKLREVLSDKILAAFTSSNKTIMTAHAETGKEVTWVL